jgi:hypothetical protein
MEIDAKVAAAISTAVTAYIEAESAAEQAAACARFVGPVASLWGQSGRQEIMRNRQLWQLRIVPRK